MPSWIHSAEEPASTTNGLSTCQSSDCSATDGAPRSWTSLHPRKCKVQPILHKSGQRHELISGCLHDRLVTQSPLPLPPSTSSIQDGGQASTQPIERYPHSPMVASPAMVLNSNDDGCRSTLTSHHAKSSFAQGRPDLPSRPPVTSSEGLEDFPSIDQILLAARKPCTRLLYAYKWNVFRRFSAVRNLPFLHATLEGLLTFLHHLFKQGRSFHLKGL